MHDIRIELTYDVEHMVTRDNIVTILMESKLHRQNEPYVAPFEIDFVEDHVLFPGQNFDRMRLLFTDQTIIPTTTPNLQKLDVSNKHPASRRGISSLTTAGDSSPAAFFANIKSDYQKPNDPTFTNATSLPLLQLQAAQTISKSLQMSTDNTGTNITNNPPF